MEVSSLARVALIPLLSACFAGCSMAGAVQQNAFEYNASVANYNDQMLLYTILRARDEAPINILALSTINGSVSMQASLGATSTYQHFGGSPSAPELNFSQTLAPGISASSSPSWSMASLDTQGFTLGIIQPISPMYVVSKWSSGIDREFLLRLFIKAIQLKDVHGYHEYVNDPSSPAKLAEFVRLLHSWFPQVGMRSLTVLEPLGPKLDPAAVTSVSTTLDASRKESVQTRVEKTDAINSTTQTLLETYHYLMPLGTGRYHIGNASPGKSGEVRLQLYREYQRQVVLCVPRATLRQSGMAPLGPLETEVEEEEAAAVSAYGLALKSAAKNGAGNSLEGSSSFQPAAGSASGAPAIQNGVKPSGASSLSSNLKVDRVAAVLPLQACSQDELVLPVYTEEENAKNAGTYSHVEWRSISEVIEYFGALLRSSNEDADHWTTTDEVGRVTVHTLFSLSTDGRPGFAQISYRGATYTLRSDADQMATTSRNHSMQALSILNQLISAAKVSSDIPNTQAIQIIP